MLFSNGTAISGPQKLIEPETKFMNVQYNFVEVSGHNLESSQTYGFCMDFLNHREGVMVFYQVFLLSPLQCTVTKL